MPDWKNTLYYGDNLEILREYIPRESVDLIYLDPPFNSNRNYNVLFSVGVIYSRKTSCLIATKRVLQDSLSRIPQNAPLSGYQRLVNVSLKAAKF